MRGEPVDHTSFIGRMDLRHSYHSSRGTLPVPFVHYRRDNGSFAEASR